MRCFDAKRCFNAKKGVLTMERPHSRKKKIVEGTAEVKKGEQVENPVQAGGDNEAEKTEEKEEE